MNRRVFAIVLFLGSVSLATATQSSAADPFQGADPLWILLHEPAVIREFKLSPPQSQAYENLLDAYDAKFFPLRNHPRDRVGQEVETLLNELTEDLADILSVRQLERIRQLRRRYQGSAAFLSADVKEQLGLSPDKQQAVERAVSDAREATEKLQQRLSGGESRVAIEKAYAAVKEKERRAIQAALNQKQVTAWQQALGRDFDLSRLGTPTYKAPELIDSGEWIHAEPFTLASLTGKVVIVHFYACGCINCIHNYPVYLEWYERYRDEDFVILGIHTPETAFEENPENVRQKAADADLPFPVLIDGERKNWDAWGNSMWPSVYLLDKQGRLRAFWPGELKWQGATGDQWMATRIEQLLAE